MSVSWNTLDTTNSTQRGRKLGFALPLRTDKEETPNLEKFHAKDCPFRADRKLFLIRIIQLKSLKKRFSLRSETDDGLLSCSIFPERTSSYELDKPVLPEIEHLRAKIGEGEFKSLKEVLDRNADIFFPKV